MFVLETMTWQGSKEADFVHILGHVFHIIELSEWRHRSSSNISHKTKLGKGSKKLIEFSIKGWVGVSGGGQIQF